MPWPWRSFTSTKARRGWVPSLTSMLAVPVVTKARNRSSNGSARGFRHKSHRIFRAERELLQRIEVPLAYKAVLHGVFPALTRVSYSKVTGDFRAITRHPHIS